MKKILVATGYGRFAPQYFGYAQRLAHSFDASITLVYVYNYPLPSSDSLDDMDDDAYVAQARSAEKAYHKSEVDRLKKFAKEYSLLEFQHIKVESIVREGIIEIELSSLIDEGGYDLLILGMRKHRLNDRLLGNVIQQIIDEVDIPTLLIPPLANVRLVKEIVYATAFDIGTSKTVAYIFDWCLAFNAKVTIAHVCAVSDKEKARQQLNDLGDTYLKERQAGILSTKLLFGVVQTELNDYTLRSNADLLVIHKRKRGFWNTIISDNLSLEMTEKLNIPLLVLKNISKKDTARLS